MIRVTMELVPGGVGEPQHLGTAVIYNDASGTKTRGNYVVALSQRGHPERIWRRGRVRGFQRKKMLAWDLLYLALKDVLGDRHGG